MHSMEAAANLKIHMISLCISTFGAYERIYLPLSIIIVVIRPVSTTAPCSRPAQESNRTTGSHTARGLNHRRRQTHVGPPRRLPGCTPDNPGPGAPQPPSRPAASKSPHHGLHRTDSGKSWRTASPPASRPWTRSHPDCDTKPPPTSANVPHNPGPGAPQRPVCPATHLSAWPRHPPDKSPIRFYHGTVCRCLQKTNRCSNNITRLSYKYQNISVDLWDQHG
jgi:hypothetical protein